MGTPTVLIGWNEYVDIPEWGIRQLRAKVDTGAKNSAIHVENVEEMSRGRVRFDVVLHRMQRVRPVRVTTRIARRGRVRSSTGHYERRIFVNAVVRIGPVEREVQLSLMDRGRMTFRMLLGRTALAGAFWIDPARRYLLCPSRRLKGGAREKPPRE